MSFLINTGATLTFTSGSVAVTVGGTNAVSEGALPGDFAIDPSGLALPITAVASGTLTLARPAPGSGTVSFVVMLGPARSLVAQATATTRDVWAQITAWADRGLSIPVIAQQNAPPSTPADGDRYLVGTAGSGAWAAKNNLIATWSATAGCWLFTTPSAGWQVTVNASFVRLQYSGSAWGVLSAAPDAATVAGRLAYFTSTTGQLGQAQASEDGSGNLATVGQVRSGGSISAGGGSANTTGIGRAVTISSTAADGLSGVEFLSGGTLHGLTMFNNAGGEIGTVTNLPFLLKQNNATRVTINASAITAALPIAASAGLTGTTAALTTRVDIGTVGSLGLPLQVAGNAQFGPKAGPGVRYQVVSTTYQLAGINHDNNAYNALALSTTGNNDLLVDTSGNVTVRVNLGPATDNAVNLGSGSFRWATVYAGTGTINTSDETDKTELRPLSDAERRVARRIFGMIGVFQWLAAVDEKGEEGARLHVGVTAQALRRAFEAEGLAAARYGVWCCDPVMKLETRTRKVLREKVEEVTVSVKVIEIVQGQPVQQIVERVEERPVGAMVPVRDAAGEPLWHAPEPVTEEVEVGVGDKVVRVRRQKADEQGRGLFHPPRPVLHFVPEMEEVEESYSVEVETGETREGIRPDQLYAFVTAGAAEVVQELQARLTALEEGA
jgi:hypothetical protein